MGFFGIFWGEHPPGILAAILVAHLNKTDLTALSGSSRFLFQSINFEECFSNRRYRDVTIHLINKILDGSFNEDFKCAVKSISNLDNPSEEETGTLENRIIYHAENNYMQDYLNLEWDSLCHFISHSNVICNIYKLFEALYIWLRISRKNRAMSVPRVNLSDHDYIKDVIDIKLDRCWGKLSKVYLELSQRTSPVTAQLFTSFLNSEELSHDDREISVTFKSKQEYSPDDIFTLENRQILFVSDAGNKYPACMEKSKCGIIINCILRKEGEDIECFLLEAVQDGTVNDENDIHIHNEFDISENNVGILLEITSKDREIVTPMPFNCVPCKNAKGYWHWGFHQFSGHDKRLCAPPVRYTFAHEVNAGINFVLILNTSIDN